MDGAGNKFLVQFFLPLLGGPEREAEALARVEAEVTEKFGGVTCFLTAPAQGRWRDGKGRVERDELVLFEVLTADLDAGWWANYRRELERRFAQEKILMRALPSTEL
jgi:hypothetical protein